STADVRIALGDLSKAPPALFRPPIPPTTDNPLLPAQRQLPSIRPSEFAVMRQLFADARTAERLAMSSARSVVTQKGAPVLVASVGSTRVAPKATTEIRKTYRMSPKYGAFSPILHGERPLRIVANTA